MTEPPHNDAEPDTMNTTGAHERLSTDLSTRRLLINARNGDERALESLFRRYREPLRRWARGRLPSAARNLLETEDLVQDAFVGALRNVDDFEPRHAGAFQGYLRRAVSNRIRDEVRRGRGRPLQDGTGGRLVDRGASPIEQMVGRELLDRYETALARLELGDREAVFARVELQLPFSEIAEYLDKPSTDAARMAVNRALLRLARKMADGT